MVNGDLCIAWSWEHDADFVRLLDAACRSLGTSLIQVTPYNLEDSLRALAMDQLSFRALLDRASDADERFLSVVQWARDRGVYRINPHERAKRTWDKADMHVALLDAGLPVPYTIILPCFRDHPVLPPIDLALLGNRLTIKPAHGGGGEGVVVEAASLSQVVAARQQYPNDRYLLQTHVVPIRLESRPAWFRVLYCAGQTYPCWWDTSSHLYTPVTTVEEAEYALTTLRRMTASIAHVCDLELFSTEIALTSSGFFVAIDYINDPTDLRLRSRAMDGVPDEIVRDIAGRLAALVATHCLAARGPVGFCFDTD